MNTRAIAAEYRLSHWAQIMRDRKESGLSIKAFCERAGFHENIYFYWQRKLRETACEQFVGLSNEIATTSQMPSGFVEAKLSNPSKRAVIQDDVRSGEIRVEIAGMRITADEAYPTARLMELLKELVVSC